MSGSGFLVSSKFEYDGPISRCLCWSQNTVTHGLFSKVFSSTFTNISNIPGFSTSKTRATNCMSGSGFLATLTTYNRISMFLSVSA